MQTKASLFDPEIVRLAEIAKALSHPARIAILQILVRKNTCICGELVEDLPLAQATVSQHLKVLKAAGLVQGEVEGPRSCYCIHPEAVEGLARMMGELLASLQRPAGDPSCC